MGFWRTEKPRHEHEIPWRKQRQEAAPAPARVTKGRPRFCKLQSLEATGPGAEDRKRGEAIAHVGKAAGCSSAGHGAEGPAGSGIRPVMVTATGNKQEDAALLPHPQRSCSQGLEGSRWQSLPTPPHRSAGLRGQGAWS